MKLRRLPSATVQGPSAKRTIANALKLEELALPNVLALTAATMKSLAKPSQRRMLDQDANAKRVTAPRTIVNAIVLEKDALKSADVLTVKMDNNWGTNPHRIKFFFLGGSRRKKLKEILSCQLWISPFWPEIVRTAICSFETLA